MPVISAVGSLGSWVTGGTASAGSIAASTIGGALVGAAAGAVVSAVNGGDIAKGAIIGAIGGAVIGGVGAAATADSWLGSKDAAGGLSKEATGSGGLSAASRAGDTLADIETAQAAAETAAPVMGQATSQQGLTFTQQALLEGVKGGASALLTSEDDDSLEIARMRYRPNEIPKMVKQETEPQEQKKRQPIATPVQQANDEMLDLKTMIAQITPQKPKGALSVNPGNLSVAVNDEVA